MIEREGGYGRGWTAVVLLLMTGAVLLTASHSFLAMRVDPPIYPGPGVTHVVALSDYFEGLIGTPADTAVYILEGSEPGGTALVLGGTHANEPASSLTAITLIENAQVTRGRLIVIPRANHSAFTCTEPQEGYPQTYTIETPAGPREFRYGSRGTNPIDQWPDPVIYVNAAGQSLAGSEVRNLNRSYPGSPSGNLTEQVAYAIVKLIRQEDIDISIDLHEASPEYPVINAIVAHEDALNIAAEAAMFLEFEGMQIGVERSPANLRGLSHREWGDATDTLALLVEAPNPAQGRLRGQTTAKLIVEGIDPYYVRAAQRGLLYVPFSAEGHPIDERVGRHLQTVATLLDVYNSYTNDDIVVAGIPTLSAVLEQGLGAFLAPPSGPESGL
ncbi:MAG: succinylglutamate desuccinylase [Candidatus Atribacteria bacterium]|nr:MAG: succinylglutamate desuccinylase [Candidatus Atribacteria bacterium]